MAYFYEIGCCATFTARTTNAPNKKTSRAAWIAQAEGERGKKATLLNPDEPNQTMSSRPILPLPKSTIDLIAAGEVIQRPSAIIKELIENSLDASSTSIDVYSKSLDVTVSDNGSGINKDDLKLACVRFATSKIVNYEDLRDVKTFGFRGEALASMQQLCLHCCEADWCHGYRLSANKQY